MARKVYTLGELAELLDVALEGDPDCKVESLGTLSNAGPGQLSFLSNPAYTDQLQNCRASAVILDKASANRFAGNKLISDNPYVSYALASHCFDMASVQEKTGIDAAASVASDATIGENVYIGARAVVESGAKVGNGSYIGPGCYIGRDCLLGDDCYLNANVTLYHGVKLGLGVIIHSGSVIGADGFGYAFDGEKSIKIHQLGSVDIGDRVEIGAGTTIDRGAIEDTVIEQGVKIDNQVQIGHNCHIGAHTIICGCTAIAGSVTIGEYCILGGASGVVGHITIADKVQVSAMSLVSQSINEPGRYSSGTGQMKTSQWKRAIVRFQQLDKLAAKIRKLEKNQS